MAHFISISKTPFMIKCFYFGGDLEQKSGFFFMNLLYKSTVSDLDVMVQPF